MPSTYQLGGLIDIEDPTVSGVFPLDPDYDVERQLGYGYQVHKISLKKEQRIITKSHGSTWVIRHTFVTQPDLDTLFDFYDSHRLPSQLFYFYDPFESGGCSDPTGEETDGRYVVRFKDSELNYQAIRDLVFSGGLELIEVNADTTPIATGSFWTYKTDRYPTDFGGGQYVLEFLSQANITGSAELIPLVLIRAQTSDDHSKTWFVSDRLVSHSQTFGAAPTHVHGTYLPRLLTWEMTQEIGGGDSCTLVLDDADGVCSEFVKQLSIERWRVEFRVHKNNLHGQWLIQLWAGRVAEWEASREQGTFTIHCEGGLHALGHTMPRRVASITCPWKFDDGRFCRYSAIGSGGNPSACDKTLADCDAHGMRNSFGGVAPKPVPATGRLNDTGFAGLFRQTYESLSTPLKTAQGEPIPMVYGNGRQIVSATVFETRDESEFFVGAGFFSEGPVEQVGQVLLDGQTMHPGYDPIVALGNYEQNIGTHIDPDFRSSGTAFVSVRRVDEVGFKNPNDTHALLVEVLRGLDGYRIFWWIGPFANGGPVNTSNPAHIALDFLIRALGLWPEPNPAVLKDELVEVDTFLAAEAFCDTVVDKLVGSGTEPRFQFRGVIRDQKSAAEHLRDILGNAPIDLVFSFGKFAFKPRKNDIATPPATQITFEFEENIIQNSFRSKRWEPKFNELVLNFSDEEIDFNQNARTVYDENHQRRIGHANLYAGGDVRPHVKQQTINLSGAVNRSQVLRLGTQLLREELGGATEEEQEDAREVEMSVPLIGMAVEVGDISKVIHPDLPTGQAYVRWNRWRMAGWEVSLGGRTVTESMYEPVETVEDAPEPSDPVPGIPGGSQGSGDSANDLEALVPPVLWLISQNYRTANVGVTCGEAPAIAAPEYEPPPTPLPPDVPPPDEEEPEPAPADPPPNPPPPDPDPVPPPTPVIPPTTDPLRFFQGPSTWYKQIPSSPTISANSSSYVGFLNGVSTIITLSTSEWSVPIYYATASTPLYTIEILEQDPVARNSILSHGWHLNVPIPAGATQSGAAGTLAGEYRDGHMVVISADRLTCWDFFYARPLLRKSGRVRRQDLTGTGIIQPFIPGNCRVAPAPLLHGLVTYDEIQSGVISHAIAYAVYSAKTGSPGVYPMVGPNSGDSAAAFAPWLGMRFQLNPSFNIDNIGLSGPARVVARALQVYGMIFVENNGPGSSGLYFENLDYHPSRKWTGILSPMSIAAIPVSQFRLIDPLVP